MQTGVFVKDNLNQMPLEAQSVDKAYQKLIELNLIPSTPRARGVANKIATIVDHLSGGPEEASAKFIADKGWSDPHRMMRVTGRTDVKFWEFLWETYRDLGGNKNRRRARNTDPSGDDQRPSEPGRCDQLSRDTRRTSTPSCAFLRENS